MTIRVLLADDHLVVRAGIRQFLAQSPDIEVIAEADDGLMAQALVNQHQPDVVVLDIHMPKANGIEVARWIPPLTRIGTENDNFFQLGEYHQS